MTNSIGEIDEALCGHRYLLVQDKVKGEEIHRCSVELVYEEPVEKERLTHVGEIAVTTSSERFRKPSPSLWSHAEQSTVLVQDLEGEGLKHYLESRFQEARAWHSDGRGWNK